MITKEQLLTTIRDLPEKFSIDELMDRIILLHKIEVGMSQSNLGQTKSTEQAKERLKKWLK